MRRWWWERFKSGVDIYLAKHKILSELFKRTIDERTFEMTETEEYEDLIDQLEKDSVWEIKSAAPISRGIDLLLKYTPKCACQILERIGIVRAVFIMSDLRQRAAVNESAANIVAMADARKIFQVYVSPIK